ncbi:MAG TPA: hypothetical protein VMW11_09515 [Candidatus Dormibacteraeota bacterium]|nr:hypothetical protein [Candidatus Dormibacteraeota bacterium]
MDEEDANSRRCEDRRGTYEAWFVTVNDPASRRGFWIRYTTFSPAAGGTRAEAHTALWAFAFDHDDPGLNWGGKQTFTLDALQCVSRPFHLRLGDATMDAGGCSGELKSDQGSARWRLRWESRERPFPFLDPRFQGVSSVANVGARPAIAVTGTIDVAGRTFNLDRAPGGQQHTWGTAHALDWNWGFASGPDFWIDGATSRIRSRFGSILTGTALGAHAGSESFRSNGLLQVLRNRGPISADGWVAGARLDGCRLDVSIRPRRQDLIGVTYADPRGGVRYCYHTEVADLTLKLSRRGQPVVDINRPAAAAFEYASETSLAGVPLVM